MEKEPHDNNASVAKPVVMDKATDNEGRDVRALKLIERKIADKEVKLFVGAMLEPRIFISTDLHEKNWGVDELRVEEWLAALFWKETGEILRDREINRVLKIVRGIAHTQERRESQDRKLVEILQKEPVL